MKGLRVALVTLAVLAWPVIGSAQAPAAGAPTPNAAPTGRGRGGRGGAAAAPAEPARGSASIRETDTFQLRTGVSAILDWRVGVPVSAFQKLTFAEAAAKADALSVSSIEGSGTQKVSAQIPKNLDPKLFPGELKAVRDRLQALNLRMPAYSVASISADEQTLRKLFEFAKNLGVETIVSEQIPEAMPLVGKLADEYGVDVAVCGNPKNVLAAIGRSQSKRVGACGNTAVWLKDGVKPVEALTQLKNQLRVVHLRDRTALGSGGRDVALGRGVAGIAELLEEMYRMDVKPSLITVGPSGGDDPFIDLSRSLQGFEKAVQLVVADRVAQLSRMAPIKGPERLAPGVKEKVEAAVPAQAAAKPKKSRQLLVFDLNVGYGGANGGHVSIAAANLAVDLMGKRTGIYEPVFSNDLDNFKYEKLRHFDAVLLNNTVGMVFPDPEVRESLLRFVREGGGLAAYHGASYASMDWPEFGEMLGTRQGHAQDNYETATVKIDDRSSPLTVPLGGKAFVHEDEYYRFDSPPYSREKLHVLLSIDIDKTDLNQGRGCLKPCVRADNDYALSWIRSYGKGRVFYLSLGHDPAFFTSPPLVDFFMRGIQFALGDLDADATPSAKLAGVKGK
jgi:type 1 glutamine amidotransferase/sugar phosphate isomerase/epimerase